MVLIIINLGIAEKRKRKHIRRLKLEVEWKNIATFNLQYSIMQYTRACIYIYIE